MTVWGVRAGLGIVGLHVCAVLSIIGPRYWRLYSREGEGSSVSASVILSPHGLKEFVFQERL